jgi:hypothetical protein
MIPGLMESTLAPRCPSADTVILGSHHRQPRRAAAFSWLVPIALGAGRGQQHLGASVEANVARASLARDLHVPDLGGPSGALHDRRRQECVAVTGCGEQIALRLDRRWRCDVSGRVGSGGGQRIPGDHRHFDHPQQRGTAGAAGGLHRDALHHGGDISGQLCRICGLGKVAFLLSPA